MPKYDVIMAPKMFGENVENDGKAIKQLVKSILSSANTSLTKTVELINQKHTEDHQSSQNISNKIGRGTVNFAEIARIAEACGFCITFHPIGSNISEFEVKEDISPEQSNPGKSVFSQAVVYGYASCNSPNFGEIIIAGGQAEEAAEWMKEHINQTMSEAQEVSMILSANKKFNVVSRMTNQ